VVVDAEFNGTNKTTLRSERSCVPEKRKREQKIQKSSWHEPALLEMSGYDGGLNGSTQH
jgi:hypothetical protein